jgi:hypothetical protein
MKKRFVLFLLLGGVLVCGYAQRKGVFASMEDSIIQLHREIILENNTILRNQKNEQLLYLLEETIELKNSISYSFDSLKTISVLTSPDKKVRLFTWYLVNDNGLHEHYGFVQTYNEEKKEYKVCTLIDRWKRIDKPDAKPLTCTNWYGAVYTELIEVKTLNGKIYYTLLGWNGGDVFSQSKVIEILFVNMKGVPAFGAPLFKGYTPKGSPLRIVFEYAKRTPFLLHYDKQLYTEKTTRKDKTTNKYIVDEISADMIVFNRLIPMDESLGQIPQFMVGEASINDGLIFVEKIGKWVYKPDIIARNPDNTRPPPREVKQRIFYEPVK